MDRLLTFEEAAARLGTPTRFVRRLFAERRIPFSKIGKYVRFRAEDIDSFIDAGRIEPTVRFRVAK
jgi:excisionase family DNA binding protein